jgi:protein-disulfide isomerase
MQELVRKLLLLAIGVCLGGVVVLALVANDLSKASLKTSQIPGLLHGIPQDGPHLGNKHAPVEVLEFVDLHCPACQNAVSTDSQELIKQYVKTGRVQWTLAPIALLGESSKAPALEAYQAGQEDKLFQYVLGYYAGGNQDAISLSGLKLGQPISPKAQKDLLAASKLAKIWQVDATPTVLVHSAKGWLQLPKNHFSLQDIRTAISR